MLAIVALETAAIALLGLLVAGLLRSHAEILRQLHHLGIDMNPDGAMPRTRQATRRGVRDAATALRGETPEGDVVTVALDRAGERTLLLFLSSGCATCAPLWEGLGATPIPDTRVVVVTRDPAEESPAALVGRAPSDVAVLMSSAAWETFKVPGSPYAVMVEDGAVSGLGVARGWAQLASLIAGQRRDVDRQLLAAGIHPGHPSLYPEP